MPEGHGDEVVENGGGKVARNGGQHLGAGGDGTDGGEVYSGPKEQTSFRSVSIVCLTEFLFY